MQIFNVLVFYTHTVSCFFLKRTKYIDQARAQDCVILSSHMNEVSYLDQSMFGVRRQQFDLKDNSFYTIPAIFTMLFCDPLQKYLKEIRPG